MESVSELIGKHIRNESMTAHVGVGYKNLKTKEEFYYNGDDLFPAASVFKVLILTELFNQKIQNKIDLNERYTYKENQISLGSGVLRELSRPIEMSYKDYATLMMIISDNTASDVMLNKVGKSNVKLMIDKLSLKNTKSDLACKDLLLGMYGVTKSDTPEIIQEKIKEKKVEKECPILVNCQIENNVTSPKDMVELFSKIYNKEILDANSCDEMIGIMKSCQTNTRIPRWLPENVSIAHKTGTLDRIANDVGIVYTDEADYIIVVFYNGNKADDEFYKKNVKGTFGDKFIADISRDLYNHIKMGNVIKFKRSMIL
ncbi:MAG: serine hydrolase [Sedimentibacter sp.]